MKIPTTRIRNIEHILIRHPHIDDLRDIQFAFHVPTKFNRILVTKRKLPERVEAYKFEDETGLRKTKQRNESNSRKQDIQFRRAKGMLSKTTHLQIPKIVLKVTSSNPLLWP